MWQNVESHDLPLFIYVHNFFNLTFYADWQHDPNTPIPYITQPYFLLISEIPRLKEVVDNLVNALNADIDLPPPPPCLLCPWGSPQCKPPAADNADSTMSSGSSQKSATLRGSLPQCKPLAADIANSTMFSRSSQKSAPLRGSSPQSKPPAADIAYSTIPKSGYVS